MTAFLNNRGEERAEYMKYNKSIVLKNGKIVLQGTPEEVLTAEHIYEVYGVKSSVSIHPVTGKLAITYLPEALQNIA